MSTVQENPDLREPVNGSAKPKPKRVDPEKEMIFEPIGGGEPVTLSLALARKYLAKPTVAGHMPDDVDLIKFMKLCEANRLNPWVGDAQLVGYDSWAGNQSVPTFNMIVAAQALFKRAELNPHFDGIESGVIVLAAETNALNYREGDLILTGEILMGGWARVHRDDCKMTFYDALNLSVYTTGKSRWAKDPAGMIVKCAETSALRKAFPNVGAGLYTREEMDHVIEGAVKGQSASAPGANAPEEKSGMGGALDQLAESLPRVESKPATETNFAAEASKQRQREPEPVDAKPKGDNRSDTIADLKQQIASLPEPERVSAKPEPTAAYRKLIAETNTREEMSDLIWDIDSDNNLDEDQRKLLLRAARSAESQLDA